MRSLVFIAAATIAAPVCYGSASDQPSVPSLTDRHAQQVLALEASAAQDLQQDLVKVVQEFLPLQPKLQQEQVAVKVSATVSVASYSALLDGSADSATRHADPLPGDRLVIGAANIRIIVSGPSYPTGLLLRLQERVRTHLQRRGFSIHPGNREEVWRPTATIDLQFAPRSITTPVSMVHVFSGAAALSILAFLLLIWRSNRPARRSTMAGTKNHPIPQPKPMIDLAPTHASFAMFNTDESLRISPLRGTWHIQSLGSAPDAVIQRIFRSLPLHAALAILRRVSARDRQVILQRLHLQPGVHSQLKEELLSPESPGIRRARQGHDDSRTRQKLAQCAQPIFGKMT